jgi:microcystin-dependent protein
MSIRIGESIISGVGGVSTVDSVYCTAPSSTVATQATYLPFTKVSGTMTVQNGRVVIKPGQRVQIEVALEAYNESATRQATEWWVKDYTNNANIAFFGFLLDEKQYERVPVCICQYENTTNANAEVGVYCSAVYTSGRTGGKMTVTEIGKVASSGTGNPRGTVISFMGTSAPAGYLICDGTTYNIADYSDLADFFNTQFGSKNFFGGNGTTTFAVPDLRNEFLRGYHGSASEQLSGNIGVHQDATEHLQIIYYNQKWYLDNASTSPSYRNADKSVRHSRDGQSGFGSYTSAYVESDDFMYTSRPTNVAVLFCIKY